MFYIVCCSRTSQEDMHVQSSAPHNNKDPKVTSWGNLEILATVYNELKQRHPNIQLNTARHKNLLSLDIHVGKNAV